MHIQSNSPLSTKICVAHRVASGMVVLCILFKILGIFYFDCYMSNFQLVVFLQSCCLIVFFVLWLVFIFVSYRFRVQCQMKKMAA